MNKITYKVWLISITGIAIVGIFLFEAFSPFYDMLADFQQRDFQYRLNVQHLDSLKQIESPTVETQSVMKKLENSVYSEKFGILMQRYRNYKMAGIFLISIIMVLVIVISQYLLKQRKPSVNSDKKTFSDPLEDKVGQQISWNPLKSLGNESVNKYLKKTLFGYKIKSSYPILWIGLGIFLIGAIYLYCNFMEYIALSPEPLSIMKAIYLFITSGGIVLLAGIFLLLLSFVFGDMDIFTRKRKVLREKDVFDFNQLYALQVLQKTVQRNERSFTCYELNLITTEGERYNLLNHGNKLYLLHDTIKISKILDIPVWSDGVE